MARATTVTVLIRMAGAYWVNYDATNVGHLCTTADYKLDGYTYPEVLSTTGTLEKELATDIVMNMIAYNDWRITGGYVTGQMRPIVMTQEIMDTADRLVLGSATTKRTLDMIE